VPVGEVGYPSFMPQGQLRIPIGNVLLQRKLGPGIRVNAAIGARSGMTNRHSVAGQVVDSLRSPFESRSVIAHLKATAADRDGPSLRRYAPSSSKNLDGLPRKLIEEK